MSGSASSSFRNPGCLYCSTFAACADPTCTMGEPAAVAAPFICGKRTACTTTLIREASTSASGSPSLRRLPIAERKWDYRLVRLCSYAEASACAEKFRQFPPFEMLTSSSWSCPRSGRTSELPTSTGRNDTFDHAFQILPACNHFRIELTSILHSGYWQVGSAQDDCAA